MSNEKKTFIVESEEGVRVVNADLISQKDGVVSFTNYDSGVVGYVSLNAVIGVFLKDALDDEIE